MKRIGMVIGIRADRIAAYETLHAASNPGVRDLLRKHNIHNFSIYLQELDGGRFYLFGYYEYTGDDYEIDMGHLNAEPRNQEWLGVTAPMQIPILDSVAWTTMREVYHNP
jgi:L-rhamnose mutarotase